MERQQKGAPGPCAICQKTMKDIPTVSFKSCQHAMHSRCNNVYINKCGACMMAAAPPKKEAPEIDPAPLPDPALTDTPSPTIILAPADLSLSTGVAIPPEASVLPNMSEVTISLAAGSKRLAAKARAPKPTAPHRRERITTRAISKWTVPGEGKALAGREACPVDDMPHPRALFGWLGRTLAPMSNMWLGENDDGNSIYTALFRRYPVSLGRPAADGKQEIDAPNLLGTFCLRDVWQTLEAVCLSGADLLDFMENGYTLDDLCAFPDCCLGRLLEMGLTMELILNYRAALPLKDIVCQFGITATMMIDDLGMRVRMMSNHGLTPAFVWSAGFMASDLFRADLLQDYDTWESLADDQDCKKDMGWTDAQLAVIGCWKSYRTNKPLDVEKIRLIGATPGEEIKALCLPMNFLMAIATLVPAGAPLPARRHKKTRRSSRMRPLVAKRGPHADHFSE